MKSCRHDKELGFPPPSLARIKKTVDDKWCKKLASMFKCLKCLKIKKAYCLKICNACFLFQVRCFSDFFLCLQQNLLSETYSGIDFTLNIRVP